MRNPIDETILACNSDEITHVQVKDLLREYGATKLCELRLGDVQDYLSKFDKIREGNKQAAEKAREPKGMYDFAALYAITTAARNILGFMEYAKIMKSHCGHVQASLVRVQDVNGVIAALQAAMAKHAQCETITPEDAPRSREKICTLTEGSTVVFTRDERVYRVTVRNGMTHINYEVAQS